MFDEFIVLFTSVVDREWGKRTIEGAFERKAHRMRLEG